MCVACVVMYFLFHAETDVPMFRITVFKSFSVNQTQILRYAFSAVRCILFKFNRSLLYTICDHFVGDYVYI